MPALIKTHYKCEIVWTGVVRTRPSIEVDGEAVNDLVIGWDGVAGMAHSGRTRPSDSRVLQQHAKGTEIANVRQITIVSQEELDFVAEKLGLSVINPEWVGANMVVKGLSDFSHVPPSSRLQAENGTTLIVDMQNYPCHQIGKTIERDKPGFGKAYKEHAKARRGVTAWVERPGTLRPGDLLTLHMPEQRAWQP